MHRNLLSGVVQQHVSAVLVLATCCLASACAKKVEPATTPPPAETGPTGPTNLGEGTVGTDTTPNSGITLAITSPVGNGAYLSTEQVTFSAKIVDAAGRPIVPESISWSSNLVTAGPLGTTLSFATVLGTGTHTITCTATALGLTVFATVTVPVLDGKDNMVVRLSAPAQGQVIALNQEVFSGTLPFGIEVGGFPALNLSDATVTWSTSTGQTLQPNGWSYPTPTSQIGTLQAIDVHGQATPITPGELELTVNVKENTGMRTAQTSVHIYVLMTNTPPTIQIVQPVASAPSGPAIAAIGASVALSGALADMDMTRALVPDNDLVGNWFDSVTGKIGAGNNATLPASAVGAAGKRVLTFCATDHADATACDTRPLYVSSLSDPAQARASLFTSTNDATLGLAVRTAGIKVLYNDGASNLWVGNTSGFAVIGSDGVARAPSGLPTALGPPNIAGANPQVASIDDVTVIAGQVFFATSKGLYRCDESVSATTATFTNCLALPSAAPNATPDNYNTTTPEASLASGPSGLYAAGALGLAVVGDPANASPSVNPFYRVAGGFAPSGALGQVAFVDGAPWLVSAGSAAKNGLCVPFSATAPTVTNPFNGALQQINCSLPAALTAASLAGRATKLLVATEKSHTIVYVGTDQGLVRFDKTSGLVITYDQVGGLAGNVVSALTARGGMVWVGTDSGLSRLDPATGLITNFDKADFGANKSGVSAVGVDGNGALVVQMGDADPSVFRYLGN